MFSLISAADSTMTLTPSQEPIPASYFDFNILFHPATKVPWPSEPFYGWRVWHALWYDLEPRKGQWNFGYLDGLVSMAQQHNSEMLLILAYCPQWASSNPDAQGDWGPGTAGPLRDMDDWGNYVRTVATRYKGKIHAYEIWNEPNRTRAWAGDMGMMVEMVREASSILKQVDPTTIVVSPSATGPQGVSWLRDFLKNGGSQYVDVIGYHFYLPPNSSPEGAVPLIQQVGELMQQGGIGGRPLWNTEDGWLGPDLFSDDQAAAYVARTYVLNWAAGVARYYWYAWDLHRGSNIEIVLPDNMTLTPAGRAFARIQGWMTGTVMKHCLTSENKNWVCEIDRSGTPEYIVWNEDGERSFRLSKDWRVTRVTGLSGGTRSIQGDLIQVGILPVLIQ